MGNKHDPGFAEKYMPAFQWSITDYPYNINCQQKEAMTCTMQCTSRVLYSSICFGKARPNGECVFPLKKDYLIEIWIEIDQPTKKINN